MHVGSVIGIVGNVARAKDEFFRGRITLGAEDGADPEEEDTWIVIEKARQQLGPEPGV
jgi:hypothetical protein